MPWRTATKLLSAKDEGFTAKWEGRVRLNPPYGTETFKRLHLLAKHPGDTAITFARTETKGGFFEIWDTGSSFSRAACVFTGSPRYRVQAQTPRVVSTNCRGLRPEKHPGSMYQTLMALVPSVASFDRKGGMQMKLEKGLESVKKKRPYKEVVWSKQYSSAMAKRRLSTAQRYRMPTRPSYERKQNTIEIREKALLIRFYHRFNKGVEEKGMWYTKTHQKEEM